MTLLMGVAMGIKAFEEKKPEKIIEAMRNAARILGLIVTVFYSLFALVAPQAAPSGSDGETGPPLCLPCAGFFTTKGRRVASKSSAVTEFFPTGTTISRTSDGGIPSN